MLSHTQVEAHKVILAASGPFFHAILKKTSIHTLWFAMYYNYESLLVEWSSAMARRPANISLRMEYLAR